MFQKYAVKDSNGVAIGFAYGYSDTGAREEADWKYSEALKPLSVEPIPNPRIPESVFVNFFQIWSSDERQKRFSSQRYGQAFINFCYEAKFEIINPTIWDSTNESEVHDWIIKQVDWINPIESGN